MQYRVVIPEHVRAGQYIKVHCPPDGKGSQSREAELRVPKGLKPGDSFVFDISEKDSTITIANDVDLLNSQMAASAAANNNNNNNNATNKQRSSNASSTSTTSNNNSNFLDREVLHLRDFLVALGIGLIIGISIVVGLVMGVLFATRGIPEAGPSSNAPSFLSGSPSSLHPHHHGGSPSSSMMMMGGGDASTIMGSADGNDNSNNNNVGLYQLQSLAPNYGHHYQILYGGYSRNVPASSQQSSSHLRHEEL